MSKKDFERLTNDIEQDGYRNRIVVDCDNTIIGGHSRAKALLKVGFIRNDEIEVLYPSRPLSEEEFKRINIRENLPFGEFDFDMLGNHFDANELIEWGMPSEWLPNNEVILNDESKSFNENNKELCNKCPYNLKSGEEKVTS